MRNVYPVKYYKDEGFVEYKMEIDEEDLQGVVYLQSAANSLPPKTG